MQRVTLACALVLLSAATVIAADWPMWGGDKFRNMVSSEKDIPDDFDPGKIDPETEAVDMTTTRYVKWVAKLGSQSYGNVTVADGRVFIGTNNETARDPKHRGDLGVLMVFDEKTGAFLWQLAVPKLGAGKVSDWEYLGICSSPAIEGDRVYIITNRCEVVCMDVKGMSDGNQGFADEAKFMGIEGELGPTDADILWVYDMRDELGIFPHNITSSSPLLHKGRLYTATSNGQDWSHVNVPNPNAPTLIALDMKTGELVGEEASGISKNILHSSWCSPAIGKIGDKEILIWGGGDGYVYFYDLEPVKDDGGYKVFKEMGKVDGNPKEYRFDKDGKPIRYATRPGPSEFIATPVFHDGLVYVAIGQDPEHGEGVGAITCVDPTKLGTEGAIKWRATSIERTISTPSVHDGLVYIGDYSGKVHCYDAKTGELYWSYDCEAHLWASTLVVDGKVIIGDEDGVLHVLATGKEKKVIAEVETDAPIYSSAVAANGVLYIATQTHLYAIAKE